MKDLMNWFDQHALFLSMAAAVSTLLLTATIAATPWVVARLPTDYLMQKSSTRQINRHSLMLVLRSILGFLLIMIGLVMLITPGPGIVALILGISLSEFPGKHGLLRYLATRPSVFQSLNWMRKKRGKPPFEHPAATLKQ